MPEGQHRGLRAPAGSLPADASSVDMDLYDAQTLAEALKWYLQELPSPLVPPALYSDLVHMAQGKHSWAPPVPGTFVGLEEIWEAPRKSLQHLQGGSCPHPLPDAALRADPEKDHWEHPPAMEQHGSFGEMLRESSSFALAAAWPSPAAVPRGGGAACWDERLPRLGDAGPRRKRYYNILALLPGNFLL